MPNQALVEQPNTPRLLFCRFFRVAVLRTDLQRPTAIGLTATALELIVPYPDVVGNTVIPANFLARLDITGRHHHHAILNFRIRVAGMVGKAQGIIRFTLGMQQ